MDNITRTLSAKTDMNGFSQVMVRIRIGRGFQPRIKTGVFVPRQYWNDKKQNLSIPKKLMPDLLEELQTAREKLNTVEMRIVKLVEIYGTTIDKAFIEKVLAMLKDYDGTITESIVKEYLQEENKESQQKEEAKKEEMAHRTVFDLVDTYFEEKKFSDVRERWHRCNFYSMARYQLLCQKVKKIDFYWNIDTTTKDDIKGFFAFIEKESEYCKKMPKTFEGVNNIFPYIGKKSTPRVADRGNNRIVTLKRGVKAFWTWLIESEHTTNNPLLGIDLGHETYGTPYYLTIEERNKLLDAEFKTRRLQTQRDIFEFQCMTGCRVGDLTSLKPSNVIDGILVYVPHKTKNHTNNFVARVPLTETALALIAKYEGVDKKGRLFPFICDQKYNDAIKDMLKECGIDRKVAVRNPITQENEMVPIYEKASSHMARRTFVGNAYKVVKDPNLIGRMSGHVEGSKAFVRYRDIDDDMLKEVINAIK